MKFTCAAKRLGLCGAPPDMLVPLNLHDPSKPQHYCKQCRHPMHGAAFCGYQFSDVFDQLDVERINPIAIGSKNSGRATICKPCFNDLTAAADDNRGDAGEDPVVEDTVGSQSSDGVAPVRASARTTDNLTNHQKKGRGNGGKGGNRRKTRKRKERREFTNQEKLDILDEIDRKVATQQDICRHYNATRHTVNGWRKKLDELKKAVDDSGRGNMKRLSSNDGLKRVKDALRAFYQLNDTMPKDLKIPITRTVISTKAKSISQRLLSTHAENPFLTEIECQALTSFKASESWSGKFARDCGWRSMALHGEAGNVNVNDQNLQEAIQMIRDKIKEYDPDNVYNMDETGLFFKLLPNRSYVKKDQCRTVRGTKLMKAKDRITLYVTTNATGTHMVPLSIIGKSKNPRCFKNKIKRLNYFNQNKAWSDSKVFLQWWRLFLINIRNNKKEKCLLLLDNCGPHGAELIDPTGQVTVIYLPPNTTSVYQPMDAGIIAMIKKNYRYRLLRKIFEIYGERLELRDAAKTAKMTTGTMGLNEGYAPHLFDVMEILYDVYKEIPASKVKNCWRKTTLVSFDTPFNEAMDAFLVSVDDEAMDAVSVSADDEAMDAVSVSADEAANEECNDIPVEICMGEENEEEDGITDEEAKSMFVLAANFAKNNDCQPKAGENVNELDEIVWEMALAVEECNGRTNLESMKAMVEGWIGTEETDYCKEVLATEVEALMDIDQLCNLNKAVETNNGKDDDEAIQAEEEVKKFCDFDTVNALAAKLKALSVQVDNLGNEFSSIATSVNDASDNVRFTFRRKINIEKLKKRNRRSRQPQIQCYLKKN